MKERIPRLSATLQYRVLSEDRFDSPIFSLQLLLAVALDRRPVWHRVLPPNRLSFPYTLTNHILVTRTGVCHNVVSMYRPGGTRQITVSDLSKVVVCLVAPRFERSTLILCVEQLNHSAIPANHTNR